MNLPCDAVTVLMVITCVLIYVIKTIAGIHTYNLLQPVHDTQCLPPFIKMCCIHIQWCGFCSQFIV